MGALRRLLHGLTVVGVAAARYADLQAREKQLYDNTEALQAELAKAKAAQDTAFATLAPLQARLVALRKANPGEQSAAAETLSLEIAAAETVYNFASDNVNDCRNDVKHTYELLKRVQPQMDAIKGALRA